jgi:peptidoglycan/xylan/chitin deacetylase (PgdA/CDA1 family)
MISFNLDDGWDSGFANGLPVFDAAGIHTTYYITTTHLGFEDFITSDQVASVAARGHEIGNHSRTHADLTQVSQQQAREEIFGAQEDLQALGYTPAMYAYPFGASNSTIQSMVGNAGLVGARGTDNGYIDALTNPYNLPSWDIGNKSFSEIQAIIDGAIAEKKWAILIIHKVDQNGDPESVSSEVLQETIDYVKEKNVEVVTNSEGLTRLSSN